MKHKRRKWMPRARAAIVVLTIQAAAAYGVPLANDLGEDARNAQGDCKPLLLEFSSSSCSYCQLLEEEVLNPTLLNRDYDRRVLMRKLLIDGDARLTDFDGSASVSAGQLAKRYKVSVTPTLVFVDSQGTELAKRMIGVTTLDFYGGYLDIALDDARDSLRTRGLCAE